MRNVNRNVKRPVDALRSWKIYIGVHSLRLKSWKVRWKKIVWREKMSRNRFLDISDDELDKAGIPNYQWTQYNLISHFYST